MSNNFPEASYCGHPDHGEGLPSNNFPEAPYCNHLDYGEGLPQLAAEREGHCTDCWHLRLYDHHQVSFVEADDETKDRLNTAMALTAAVTDYQGNPQTVTIRWNPDENARPGLRNPRWVVESSFPGQAEIPYGAGRLYHAHREARTRAGYILDHRLHHWIEDQEAIRKEGLWKQPQPIEDQETLAELRARDMARFQKSQSQAEADWREFQQQRNLEHPYAGRD